MPESKYNFFFYTLGRRQIYNRQSQQLFLISLKPDYLEQEGFLSESVSNLLFNLSDPQLAEQDLVGRPALLALCPQPVVTKRVLKNA